ncbi:MAG: hypothetical protein GY828_02320 [Candidatus Gracilibacteria bacterium]|nr:hypothetical protein [Candidatus Gracilibacteria bacterium]
MTSTNIHTLTIKFHPLPTASKTRWRIFFLLQFKKTTPVDNDICKYNHIGFENVFGQKLIDFLQNWKPPSIYATSEGLINMRQTRDYIDGLFHQQRLRFLLQLKTNDSDDDDENDTDNLDNVYNHVKFLTCHPYIMNQGSRPKKIKLN